jgi:hypothetical protein
MALRVISLLRSNRVALGATRTSTSIRYVSGFVNALTRPVWRECSNSFQS